jgi:hypothetical protein
MTLNVLAVSTVLALACGTLASAQVPDDARQPPTGPGATAFDDIPVRGAPTRRAEGAYARNLVGGPPGRLSPRWNDGICVRVIHMDPEHAQILRSRVETVARAIGLSPDPSPTCAPTISIFASEDPTGLATALIEAVPRNFRPVRHSVSLGDEALETFRTSDAPVRWWQVSLPLMVDTGQPAIALGANDTKNPMALAVTVRNASRLRGNVRDDLMGVTIIIDTRKVDGVPLSAVSDYIAFVALAPADPRAETLSFDSVMSLFERPGVTGLTLMDQDYLYALYTASRAPPSAALQASEIAGRMATERRRRARIQSEQAPSPLPPGEDGG